MGIIWDLNKLVEEIQIKAADENRPSGDILQEIISKLKNSEKEKG